jgi:hypothetical protein
MDQYTLVAVGYVFKILNVICVIPAKHHEASFLFLLLVIVINIIHVCISSYHFNCLVTAWPPICQFNDIVNVIFSSKPFVAGLVAYVLDNTILRHDSRKDRGYHFWERFRSFRSDTRSEEFYSLPFNLDKYFPSFWAFFFKFLFIGVGKDHR